MEEHDSVFTCFWLLVDCKAVLEGWGTGIQLQSNILNGEKMLWKGTPVFDFKERPKTEVFEEMCYHKFTIHYKKTFKTATQICQGHTASTPINFTHHDEDALERVVGINEELRFRGQAFIKKWTFNENHLGCDFCSCKTQTLGYPCHLHTSTRGQTSEYC